MGEAYSVAKPNNQKGIGTMVQLTISRIRGTAPSETIRFTNAREARSYLLQTMKLEKAEREGDGNSGKLVAGKGRAKRLVATYEIKQLP